MAVRQRPTRTRPMRLTLIGLLVVPLVSLLALWGFAASITLGNAIHERNYNKIVATSAGPSDALAYQLSQERLQTFIWLSTDRRSPVAQLDATRRRTDAAIVAYRGMVTETRSVSNAAVERAQGSLLAQLGKIPSIRAAIDSGAMTPPAAFQAYSNMADDEFAVYDVSGQIGLDLSVYDQTVPSIEVARTVELLGREAALVAGAAAAHGQMSTGDRQLFASAVANQRLLIGEALAQFNPQFRAPFERIYSSSTYRQFAAMENRITASTGSKGPVPVDIKTWEAVSKTFLGQMQAGLLQIGTPLAQLASQLGNKLLLEAILAGGVGLVAVVASILLTLWFGRRLTGELSNLHDSAQSMAGERLPSVVKRLREGEDVDVNAESPPPTPGRITEIAKVAQAFSTVQRTAVEAAVGQANLRKGVNQVFLNLSLRNQSLLHRQLGMLDSMERATNEPAALADLFRLDHLTTRMRRHAEGLIILSGATPGRGWRDPVPVVDVLRAAIAEVEDYIRVDVASDSRDAVVGAAVNDVIHLVAELVENATTFSPPNTRVEIRADVVGNGFAVEIEDRGLGLTADELADINQRLANPPEFDPANSDQLGLFVVGQLASRHGIRVSLRESPYGGTTAIVLMPHGVIVREGETGSQLMTGSGDRPAAGMANGTTFPAGTMDLVGNRARASAFSLTGRHRLEPVPDERPAEPGPADQAPHDGAGEQARATPAGEASPAVDPWLPVSQQQASPRQAPQQQAPQQPQQRMTAQRQAPWPAARQDGSREAVTAARVNQDWAGRDPAGAGTHRGLPRRVRQANLAPQLRGRARPEPAADTHAPEEPDARSPEETRSLMSSLQSGWQRGRIDDLDYPGDGPDDWPGGAPGGGPDPSDGEAV